MFVENKINETTLSLLTERMVEELIPLIGDRVTFLKQWTTICKNETASETVHSFFRNFQH